MNQLQENIEKQAGELVTEIKRMLENRYSPLIGMAFTCLIRQAYTAGALDERAKNLRETTNGK